MFIKDPSVYTIPTSNLSLRSCPWFITTYFKKTLLPKISLWGTQFINLTLLLRFSIFSSNFQITLCGIWAKASTNALLIFDGIVLLFMTDPNVNKTTPCSASSMYFCKSCWYFRIWFLKVSTLLKLYVKHNTQWT